MSGVSDESSETPLFCLQMPTLSLIKAEQAAVVEITEAFFVN